MTEPSQYFKGRTVQEQMNEVIGYVDKRSEEVAAAKANAVLQPAEEAKTAAQAAAQEAEAAKNATLAALPQIQQDISGLKAEDTALDGRLNTVELKVQTAEGNIVTIQGQIVALQNMQGDYVKKDGAAQTVTSQIMVPTTDTGARDTQIANGTRIQNDLAAYEPMVRDTGNKKISGIKQFTEFNELISSASGVQFTADKLYMKIGTITRQLNAKLTITIGGGYTAACDIIEAMIHTFNISTHYGTYAAKHYNATSGVKLYLAAINGTDGFDIWIKMPDAVLTWVMFEAHVTAYGNSVTNDAAITPGDMVPAPDPSASYSMFSEVVIS